MDDDIEPMKWFMIAVMIVILAILACVAIHEVVKYSAMSACFKASGAFANCQKLE